MLTEQPALYLEITGAADPRQDRLALAEQNFKARLVETRPEGRTAVAALEAPSPEGEAKLIQQRYAAQFRLRPDEAELPVSEQRARLVAMMPVDESALRQLAQNRAAEIRTTLVASGKVAEERVVLRDVEVKESDGEAIPVRVGVSGRS